MGRHAFIWLAVLVAIAAPLVAAAFSPLLQWRSPIYILAGFAGIFAMVLLFVQPLLAGRLLPNINPLQARRLHRISGALLVFTLLAHVIGLWLTSAPDVIDALLFRSPTPFSGWGVVAMWAVFATAILALYRRRINLRKWRIAHGTLAIIIAIGSVVHAVLVQGSMETVTKIGLCTLVLIATAKVLFDLRPKTKRAP